MRPRRRDAVSGFPVQMGCNTASTSAVWILSTRETLFRQVPVVEAWIDARAGEGAAFVVMGDFNRRLAQSGDRVWADWDDSDPNGADLSLAAGGRSARCNPVIPISSIILSSGPA